MDDYDKLKAQKDAIVKQEHDKVWNSALEAAASFVQDATLSCVAEHHDNLAAGIRALVEPADDGADLEHAEQSLLEDKAILDLLRASIRPHLSVELDCWYSCAKSDDYCGDSPRDVCTCGADQWNNKVNAVLASWGQDTQRQG